MALDTDQLEGFDELSDKLEELGLAAAGVALRNATMQATLPALNAAKADAPVGTRWHRTYYSKDSQVPPGYGKMQIVRKSFMNRSKTAAYAVIGVRKEAFYMLHFVELGTKFQRPQPWLTSAFRQSKGMMIGRMAERLKKQIDKVAS